jgi:tRNA G18 (ribose-2'-O)-methylase SpoU
MPKPDHLLISAPDDSRIEPYLNVIDRELAARSDRFIAEGEHLVRRLIASDHTIESILVSTRKADGIAAVAQNNCPVYVATDAVIRQILGYRFHSGVMACAKRPANPTLESILNRRTTTSSAIIICPEIHNSENLGSIIRIATAFNCKALLLGERCCDPWWRRCVRVSMGSVFFIPVRRSEDLTSDLKALKEQWGMQLVATVVNDDQAETLTHETSRPDHLGLMVGSESQGLSAHWLRQCDRRITIPMYESTDSLNVFVASAIFLWHFTQSQQA